MDIKMAIKLSMKSILSNKMRTFLTMLGIIIGVSAVIALVSVAKGTTQNVTERIESMGTNLISVMIRGRGEDTSLTYDEVKKLENKYGIDGVAPIVSGSVTIKYNLNTFNTTLDGIDNNYSSTRSHHVEYGRDISFLDIENRQKVVLMGKEAVNEVFQNTSPLGKTIQINGTNFTVIGTMEGKGSSIGGNDDEKIFIPITTAQRFLKSTGVRNIYVQAKSSHDVDIVQGQIEDYLTRKFNNDEDAYRILNQQEMLSTVNDITGNMTLMLGGIAAISLIVGGIGIMNIMLVSVTERTREIGIRKAIGAKRKDILTQFLLESSVISALGGFLGIIFGIFVSFILSNIFKLPLVITPVVLLISYSFAIFVGIFFGVYPANKASKLSPVDALRFE